MKKYLTVILSLMMVVTMMPVMTGVAFAEEKITEVNISINTSVDVNKSITKESMKFSSTCDQTGLMLHFLDDKGKTVYSCNLSQPGKQFWHDKEGRNIDSPDAKELLNLKVIAVVSCFGVLDKEKLSVTVNDNSLAQLEEDKLFSGEAGYVTHEVPEDKLEDTPTLGIAIPINTASDSKLKPLLIAAGITAAAVATAATVAKVVDKTMYQVKVKSDKHGIVDQLTTINVGKEATITADGNKLKVGKLNTVKAIPAKGYEFDKWVGIPADGIVTEDMTVTATFKAKEEKQEETAKTEPTIDKVKEAVEAVTIRCNTKKTADGTEVYTTVTDGDLEALEAAGYTVTYMFYRSKYAKKNYKLMETTENSTYTDTTGTEGTMYYYKAKVVVTDKDGNEVAVSAIKDCKYGNRKF